MTLHEDEFPNETIKPRQPRRIYGIREAEMNETVVKTESDFVVVKDTEALWRGSFGDAYTTRNTGRVAANTAFFSKALSRADGIKTVIELGAGIGDNLRALTNLGIDPENLIAVEINESAAMQIPIGNVQVASVLDFTLVHTCDLAFTKGVAIHIAPDDLPELYENLYNASNRYILMAEYYSPTPQMIPYRGQDNALWKRDFAGEMLDKYPNLRVVDYGFVWRRDTQPQDDLNWWLLEKK